ncbi:MAG: chromosomal replication initiator protein DnaA [Verrucomicrobia bacterium CG_4_9_14_3_um_filter_43_20]|nr:MAG: chromosomal replication initiator DnaA [Verrucomicrobia bacterium CG1_02_43_26]PJA44004.1 MAG: chromosomal replication initiator protein DnaA [Verrucomicrobia bacterium CG_4_9_14_3_um_filter_43_20]
MLSETKDVDTDIWSIVKNDFRGLFPQEVFKTWFDPMELCEETEESITLTVANDFAAIWIEDNYMDLIKKRFHMALGRPINVVLKVNPQDLDEQNAIAEKKSAKRHPEFDKETYAKPAKINNPNGKFKLNPKNTFENFVVGPGSQLAHAACIAVANAPAQAYNPLFLYGNTGLGKTHLMHAVAHQVLKNKPDANVVYISTEKFTNEFIHAIQENTLVAFRKRYRNVDILLIDDIHFLSGKERIQEEFFHTFNELFESGKQIFLASDRPAAEIAKLESRLLSRFQWGLVTDIQAPDLETRVAILSKKSAAMALDIPQKVLEFLAERVSRNVRRLEGALTRVASYLAINRGKIEVSTVERLLQDILREEAKCQITVEGIQKKVCDYYHIRQADMLSKKRPANIAFPRQIAMYLSRLLTRKSFQEIGERFGGRDHGTVIHACKTVENMIEQDESVKRNLDYLQGQLTSLHAS